MQKIIKMNPLVIPVLAVIGGSIALVTYIIVFYRSRHIERMALIENDKDASIFKVTSEEIKKSSKFVGLKWGLLLTGLGSGVGVGSIIDGIFNTDPAGIFTCMMIFGGLALIAYHILTIEKRDQHQGDEFGR